jgi:hypothetical protein
VIAIIVLIIEFIILAFFNSMDIEITDGIAIIMIIVYSIVFLGYVTSNKKLRKYKGALIAGYFMRIGLLFLDIYGKKIYVLPNSGYDSEMYFRCAVEYVVTRNPGRGEAFSAVMGTIFSFIGTNRLYSQFIVMLFSIVSLLVLAYAVNMVEGIEKDTKIRTVGIVCLLPNFAILSVIFLRESIITMLLSISVYLFVRWMLGGKEIWFIGAFAVSFLAAAFHSGSAAIAIGYITIRLIYDNKKRVVRLRAKNVLPAIFFVIVIAYLYVNYADDLFGKMNNVDSLSDIGNVNTEGGSSYAAYVGDSSSVFNMMIYTIPRIVYFLLSPFPWQWRGMGDIIAFVFSSLFYFFTIKNAFVFIKKANPQNKSYVIIVFIVALCTAFVFSWGVTNTGTATRHRDKMIILYGLLYALSHHDYGDKKIYLRNVRIL